VRLTTPGRSLRHGKRRILPASDLMPDQQNATKCTHLAKHGRLHPCQTLGRLQHQCLLQFGVFDPVQSYAAKPIVTFRADLLTGRRGARKMRLTAHGCKITQLIFPSQPP
jgi:hypothetical protein